MRLVCRAFNALVLENEEMFSSLTFGDNSETLSCLDSPDGIDAVCKHMEVWVNDLAGRCMLPLSNVAGTVYRLHADANRVTDLYLQLPFGKRGPNARFLQLLGMVLDKLESLSSISIMFIDWTEVRIYRRPQLRLTDS